MSDFIRIPITPEILLLIGEIDEFKGAWRLLTQLAPHRIQGLLSEKAHVHTTSVIIDNLDTYKTASFTEFDIKSLHKALYPSIPAGFYRTYTDTLDTDIAIPSAAEAVAQVRDLVTWTETQLRAKTLHPLLVIGVFTAIFQGIRPFPMGNTQLSYTLATWLLLKSGYLYAPYADIGSILKEIPEAHDEALKKTLQSLQTPQPNFHPWLLFFLRGLRQQKLHWEQGFFQETHDMPPLSLNILNLLQTHQHLAIREVEALTRANRNTLKKHLQDLAHRACIVMHGKGRATWYTLP